MSFGVVQGIDHELQRARVELADVDGLYSEENYGRLVSRCRVVMLRYKITGLSYGSPRCW